jgi:thymidylate synthase
MPSEGIASTVWLHQLKRIMGLGKEVGPRGMPTLELTAQIVRVMMRYPVVAHMNRKLSYQFMAAEALWIIRGSNSLTDDVQIRQKLTPYSDDGHTLSGAYGPPFVDQIGYVTEKLKEDQYSRQAIITIWRPRPFRSKDIPCTVAMQFLLRDGAVNTNVFMRSSDVWLGIPYDIFSFTIMSAIVALRLRVKSLGILSIFLGSSHLYKENWDKARALLEKGEASLLSTMPLELENRSELGLVGTLSSAATQKSNHEAFTILANWGDII